MRRTLTIFILAVVTAGTLAPGVLAKEGGVELSTTPAGKQPGEPWITSLTLIDGTPEMLAQAAPGIQITSLDTGRQVDYPAKSLGKGVYTVRVVFPEAGTWVYSAYDGVTGRMYEYPRVEITGPPLGAAKAPSASDGGSFLAWPFAAALTAFALAALGAAFVLRRLRPRLSA